jgi:hypothetical protein
MFIIHNVNILSGNLSEAKGSLIPELMFIQNSHLDQFPQVLFRILNWQRLVFRLERRRQSLSDCLASRGKVWAPGDKRDNISRNTTLLDAMLIAICPDDTWCLADNTPSANVFDQEDPVISKSIRFHSQKQVLWLFTFT